MEKRRGAYKGMGPAAGRGPGLWLSAREVGGSDWVDWDHGWDGGVGWIAAMLAASIINIVGNGGPGCRLRGASRCDSWGWQVLIGRA